MTVTDVYNAPTPGRIAQYIAEQVAESYAVETSRDTALRVLDALVELVATENAEYQAGRTGEVETAAQISAHTARYLFATGLIEILQIATGAAQIDPDERTTTDG